MFDFTIEEQTDGTFEIVSPSYIPTYVMRYENNEKGVYEYRTLAAGLWTDEDSASLLDGMTYADLQRMGAIWSEMQTVIDSSVASIARE